MTTKKQASIDVPDDVDALAPSPDVITLVSGDVVRVEPLKTRGMFKLLKIVTRGAGPILMEMPLEFDNEREFVQQLLAVILMAIPEAEDEAIDFIKSMVIPNEFIEGARPKTPEDELNKEAFARLNATLDDPHPLDTLSIIQTIVQNEAGNIQALGKGLAAILKTQLGSRTAKN